MQLEEGEEEVADLGEAGALVVPEEVPVAAGNLGRPRYEALAVGHPEETRRLSELTGSLGLVLVAAVGGQNCWTVTGNR